MRPDGFDLATEWDTILASLETRTVALRATVRVDRDMIWVLRSIFGTRITELAGLADHPEVVDPPEVRAHLAWLGAALSRRYG